MRFGVYCNNFTEANLKAVEDIRTLLRDHGASCTVFKELDQQLSQPSKDHFSNKAELVEKVDFLMTIGGDGTILSAIQFVVNTDIPVLGVNTGRLGFLTSVTPDELPELLKEIGERKFKTERRALLEVHTSEDKGKSEIALNEISVQKRDTSSMITIKASLDGELLNTYWADGLIISTATGSTAYSLSCGGPIVMPGSGNLIITPIAPHNLNVRPLVVDDQSEIELSFETRASDLLISLDSYSRLITDDVKVTIKKSSSYINLLRQDAYSYLETLRNKLNWGLDKRN